MRLLLCTDGSAHGQKALRFGALLAQGSTQPAALLGVLEKEEDRAQLEQALAEGQGWLAGAPPPRVEVRLGHPAEEILDEAAANAYDLVVVGARGRRGITRFLMGSTSERIARLAPGPVLVVRGDVLEIRRILACTGGRSPGLGVVDLAGRVARLVGAEVTVLHVMSQLAAAPMVPVAGVLQVMPQTPEPPSEAEFQLAHLEAPAEELMALKSREGLHLQQAMDILTEKGVEGRALVRHGLVLEEISDEACEGDYDLVVSGAHAAEGWMRLLTNDVGRQILHSCSDRPILVVKG